MKGKYKIVIRNRRLVFTIEVERNITVIRGDSATGKTTLVNILHNYEDLGEKSGVTLTCAKQCHVLRGEDWEDRLAKWRDSIVFVDEGSKFITSEAFASAIRGSDNYYVLITRENLYQLPYSIGAVLQVRKTTSRFKVTYNRTYPYYDRIDSFTSRLKTIWGILTEDSNAGNDMFTCIADRNGIQCLSANGKSNIMREIEKHAGERMIIVGDGAAFGAEMDPVYQYERMHPEGIFLFLPESFEWLLMSAGVVTDGEIAEILDDPSNYVESRDFFSWEQFFTYLLEKKTRGTPAQYNKKKLARYYLQDENVRKIVMAIEKKSDF